jgi:hypothetical protein
MGTVFLYIRKQRGPGEVFPARLAYTNQPGD